MSRVSKRKNRKENSESTPSTTSTSFTEPPPITPPTTVRAYFDQSGVVPKGTPKDIEEYVRAVLPRAYFYDIMPQAMLDQYCLLDRWFPITNMLLSNIPPMHNVNTVIIIHAPIFSPAWNDADLIALLVANLVGKRVKVVSPLSKLGSSTTNRSSYGSITWESAPSFTAAAEGFEKVDLILILNPKPFSPADVAALFKDLSHPKCDKTVAVILQPSSSIDRTKAMLTARRIRIATGTMEIVSRAYASATIPAEDKTSSFDEYIDREMEKDQERRKEAHIPPDPTPIGSPDTPIRLDNKIDSQGHPITPMTFGVISCLGPSEKE